MSVWPAASCDVPLDDGSDLYDDPELYELEHAGYAGDLAWYLGLCQRLRVQRALELGCGTGRLLLPLARAGVQVVGVDPSPAMIAHCQARLGELDAAARARARCLVADAREPLAVDGTVDLVVAAFNTLQHVDGHGLGQVLATMTALLRRGGHFALDLYAPARELAPGQELADRRDVVDRQGRAWQVLRRRRWRDADWLESRFEVRVHDGASESPRPERRLLQYQWSRAALLPLVTQQGFELVEEAGDLDGRTWSPSSPRWLALFRYRSAER